jgi:hypothetical protein
VSSLEALGYSKGGRLICLPSTADPPLDPLEWMETSPSVLCQMPESIQLTAVHCKAISGTWRCQPSWRRAQLWRNTTGKLVQVKLG